MTQRKNQMDFKLPEWWGNDSVTTFLSDAHNNVIASMINYKETEVIKALIEVDGLFEETSKIIISPLRESILPFFLGRSRGAYLGAVRLSLSGQVAESYALMRVCIENGLYGLYVQSDPTIGEDIPERARIWLDRNESEIAKGNCRSEFTNANVANNLKECDEKLGKIISKLYDMTIDYGAHPNLMGAVTTGEITDTGANIDLLTPGDNLACRYAIQLTIQVGLSVLSIFGIIFNKRFQKVSERLSKFDYLIEKI